ncbi:MAG TPA: GNAT family N-acetyltransferase [Candidatus Pacearchaeota archaeon]|nr:ribosomal-protein-alanine N-acetyltransferase [archaeon BMS3Abin17]HDK42463.1 GNAT family N-acetyltransferase [Candidatus Pacearchaeota archaeon]HDZ60385.1 GNAT family N-acetyltransferase [Candidatus Pacearchaeota archaeon]
MEFKARLARDEDVPKLVKIIHEEYGDDIEFMKNRLSYSIKNNFVCIVEDLSNGDIAGRLIFQAKENPFLGVGELEAVTVSDKYQEKGVGTKLLEESIKQSVNYFERYNTKIRKLYLMTRSNNEVAIKFYEKFGFKRQNTIGKIFVDNEPEELVMLKSFD